jgi:hypothetical protein
MLKICSTISVCTAIGKGIETAISRTAGVIINSAKLLIVQEYAGLWLTSQSFQVNFCVLVNQILGWPFQIPGDDH